MNRVINFEIHAKDLDKMQKFYQDIFGWEVKDMGSQFGNYRMVSTGQEGQPGINGGITPRRGDAPKGGEPMNAFVCTIDVSNIDQMLEKVLACGGLMAHDKMDIPGVGILAYCKDPDGNIFGLMQSVTK